MISSPPGHLWQQGQVHNVSSWPPLAAGPGAQCLFLAISGSRARCTMGLGWGRDARASDVGTLCFKLAQMMGTTKKKRERKKKRKKEEQYGNVDVFHPIWMVS